MCARPLERPVDPQLKMVPAGRLGSWHLPRGQTVEELAHKLNRTNARYVVLPTAVQVGAKDGRKAILISDDDIPKISRLLTLAPFGEPIAVYSTTGLPGFSYRQHWRHASDATNMAVLTPFLAEAIIDRGRLDSRGLRTAAPEDSALWAIYQAIYLSTADQVEELGERSAAILARLVAAGDVQPFGALDFPSLDERLSSAGWTPPYDVLRRLSQWNEWAAKKVAAIDAQTAAEEPGLAVFFVRAKTAERGLTEEIGQTLEACGFELLAKVDFSDEQAAKIARATRGGNWGKGNSPIDGGPPTCMFVCFDVSPATTKPDILKDRPFLDNGRIFDAKRRCRRLLREKVSAKLFFNPVHSTDDSREAWRAIRMVAPELEPSLRSAMAERKEAFATKFKVLRNLTRHGHRAKVELIEYGDKVAVKKTFRSNCLRFLQREASFLEEISRERPEILPILARGPNYIVTPYVDARPMRAALFGESFPKLLPLRHVRTTSDLMRYLFSRGYDPIDMAPHNLLIDRSGSLMAIDFEFVYRCEKPIDPHESACLDGIKKGFPGEFAAEGRWCLDDPYRERWFGYTGLSRRSFLEDPVWRQRLQRGFNYPRFILTKAVFRQGRRTLASAKQRLKSSVPFLGLFADSRRGARIR